MMGDESRTNEIKPRVAIPSLLMGRSAIKMLVQRCFSARSRHLLDSGFSLKLTRTRVTIEVRGWSPGEGGYCHCHAASSAASLSRELPLMVRTVWTFPLASTCNSRSTFPSTRLNSANFGYFGWTILIGCRAEACSLSVGPVSVGPVADEDSPIALNPGGCGNGRELVTRGSVR